MNMIARYAVAVLFNACFLLLSACDGSNPEDQLVTASILVANQGNFSEGTGSITAYDPSTSTSSTFADNFGSIIQSIFAKGDTLYAMANSASRVDIFSLATGARIGQIQDVASPRYMTTNGGNVGYITNLFDSPTSFSGGSITIVNLDTNTVADTVNVGPNPEGIISVGPRLFVANTSFGEGTTISMVDQLTEAVIATIEMNCFGPQFMVLDSDVEVVVACSGATIYDENFNPVEELDGEIVVFDGATITEVERITITGKIQTAGGIGLSVFHSPNTNEIFLVRDGNTVLRFDTRSNLIVDEMTISGSPIGAIAYDDLTEKLYLGRVPGFAQNGSVTIHERDGTQTGSFAAGIAPAQILLVRETR